MWPFFLPMILCTRTVAMVTSIADKAWSMLRTALGRLCGDECAMMYKCVAKKLLSMGKDLPQWMLDTYKVCSSLWHL